MKLVNKIEGRFPFYLHQAEPGDCVQFECAFDQKHTRYDKFLVLRVPTEYAKYEKQVMVANLETGNASFITTGCRVRIVDAEVVTQ